MGRLLTVAVAAAVPLALVAAALWLLASPAFLQWEYGRAGFPAAAGISDEERLALAVPSTLYITRLGWAADDLSSLSLGGAPLYTESEIAHLVDVRRLVARITALGIAGTAVLVGALLAAWRRPDLRRRVGHGLVAGAVMVLAAVAMLGVLATTAWRLTFTAFHEILFPPGTWAFASSSGLIRLFPERFWFDAAVSLLATVTLGALGALAAGGLLARRAQAE